MPSDYTIEVNSANGGECPRDGWEVAADVKGNTLHSRQHIVDMKGYNWIRMMVTGTDGKLGGIAGINFDIHNISSGVPDSWIFYGDSITACGMMNCYGTGFAELINKINSNYFPVQEDGGIGGITSTDGVNNIDRWLDVFPGKYVSIAYGTNDSWGNQTGAQKYYENTINMINKILALGKIPVLPKIPYATEPGVKDYLANYNAMIDKIYSEYPQVIKGPDFEDFFYNNTGLLSGDGVHPSNDGYAAMRELWAETMYKEVYSAESAEIIPGDINNDGIVDYDDDKLLTDYLLNRAPITYINADKTTDLNNDGHVNVFDLNILKTKITNS
jgi:lysophospholipase L1-like esterase